MAAQELIDAGLWNSFDEDGTPYIVYPSFSKWQDLRKRSENPRDGLPKPPADLLTGSSRQLPEVPVNSGDFPEENGIDGLACARGREEKRTEENRRECLPTQPFLPPQQGTPQEPNTCVDDDRLLDGGFWMEWYTILGPVERTQPNWRGVKAKKFSSWLIRAIEDPNGDVTRQEVEGWLATNPPALTFEGKPQNWLAKRIGERNEKQRAQGRASPGTDKFAPATQAAFAAAAAAREAQTAGKG